MVLEPASANYMWRCQFRTHSVCRPVRRLWSPVTLLHRGVIEIETFFERLVATHTVTDEIASYYGAGAPDSTPAVDIHDLATSDGRVDNVENLMHHRGRRRHVDVSDADAVICGFDSALSRLPERSIFLFDDFSRVFTQPGSTAACRKRQEPAKTDNRS